MKSDNRLLNIWIAAKRICKMALISLWRNRLLSLATTIIIILALFIISIFSLTTVFVNKSSQVLRDKVNLTVYLKDSDSDDQVSALKDIISARPEVTSINYVSKEMALSRWQESTQNDQSLQNVISETENPLPRSFEVKTSTPEQIETVANFLDNEDYAPLIEKINYKDTKDIIDRLVKITTFVRSIGWSLSGLFLLISILIVYNTVRLTIYIRSDEIEIMRLVGASDLYVRGPFVVEGTVYGLVGAIVASILFYVLARVTINPAESYLGVAGLSTTLTASVWIIIAAIIVIGILMGAFCSFLAMRRYLFSNTKK